MKRLIYQVYVGKKSKLYDHCVASVKAYCEKYGIDHEVQKTPILMIKPDLFSTNRNPRAWEDYGGFMPIFEKENNIMQLEVFLGITRRSALDFKDCNAISFGLRTAIFKPNHVY